MQLNTKNGMKDKNGFSLLEALVVITLVSLLALLGAPSIAESIKHQQLKGALQHSYFLLKKARSMAISLNQNITVQFQNQPQWCIALSDSGPCDCMLINDCLVENVAYRLQAEDYPQIALPKIIMGKNNTVAFDNTRGIAVGNAGSSIFSDGKNQAKLIVSNLGRVRVCMLTGSLGAYRQC